MLSINGSLSSPHMSRDVSGNYIVMKYIVMKFYHGQCMWIPLSGEYYLHNSWINQSECNPHLK